MNQKRPTPKDASRLIALAIIVFVGLQIETVAAQSRNKGRGPSLFNGTFDSSEVPNLKLPTLGGNQYWSDVKIVGGWKIQRNLATQHFRLLDDNDVRQAWGDYQTCEEELRLELQKKKIIPEQGRVVILLHGLLRSSDSMNKLADFLQEEGKFATINFNYASSLASLESHAADLHCVIESLGEDVTEINFVAHSMGNIVVRRYLHELERRPSGIDPRIKRMVMLAPPNQGSSAARSWGRSTILFEKIAGPSGVQLGVGWDQLLPQLATPSFEFGIIIGGKEEPADPSGKEAPVDHPLSFLKQGNIEPHDFTVGVEEAKLDGCNDFLVGPYFHWDVKHHPQAMQQTLHFLQQGRFDRSLEVEPVRSSRKRNPK